MTSPSLNEKIIAPEKFGNFTDAEHNTWKILFERQSKLLQNRAVDKIMQGMDQLAMCNTKIPELEALNSILKKTTGFTIVPVTGLITEKLFFSFLSERMFPTTCFIRRPDQLDYLEEPDIFHDVFGHVPLLVNPVYAAFVEEFGIKGLEACKLGLARYAITLYWFTVEFGLITTPDGLRIYGAGIASSSEESVYALESNIPVRIKFNPLRVMKTKYRTDCIQKTYFVIESFDELFDAVRNLDWKEVANICQLFPEIDQGVFINGKEQVLI